MYNVKPVNPVFNSLGASEPSLSNFIPEREAIVRQYRAGDEEQLLALFNKVLGNGSPKTVDQFQWQFWNHPRGGGWLSVAEMDGKIIGLLAIMRQHLNYSGREIAGGQGVDLAVSPEHRRKGLFIRMREHSRKCTDDLEVAVVSFPNRKAYLALINYPGWFKVAHLKSFIYEFGWKRIGAIGGGITCNILGTVNSLKNKLRVSWTREPKNAGIVHSSSLPDDVEEMLWEINAFEVLSFWKDLAYLKWRYENHPKHRYTFHLLRIANRVQGLVVSRNCGAWIALCEVMSRTKNVEETTFLLHHVLHYYSRPDTPATEIRFWGFDSGFFETAFQAAGFTMRNTSGIVWGIRTPPGSPLEKLALLPHNWTISYGDTDHI